MDKHALSALLAALFVAALSFIFAPLWTDLSDYMKSLMGAPLVALIGVLTIMGLTIFFVSVLRYFELLGAGAAQEGSRERADYEALRSRIAGGNWIAREYARRLTAFLDGVDRFFGDARTAGESDASVAQRTLFPRAFGLRRPAPLWTAPAFDRCLLLALVYPIAAILLIWMVSNHVGPAEAALRLRPADEWSRGVTAGAIAIISFAMWRSVQTRGWRGLAWLAVAVVVAGVVAGVVAVVVAGVVAWTSVNAIERGWQGVFLSLFASLMMVLCLVGAMYLSPLPTWQVAGALLLFFGLLTLVNAPFDWFSLGLTRALMRRGLEREKWWPYLYATFDALAAAAIVAVLAVAIVIGVQWFEELAVYGGGERLLPPMREYLDAIKADPARPEFWWIYAMLFSTMVPSLINLFIAGFCLARGVPGISPWLLKKMKQGEAVPAYDRFSVALVLSLQGVIAVTIAVVAQGIFFWVIILQAMPRLGIGVLDLAYIVVH